MRFNLKISALQAWYLALEVFFSSKILDYSFSCRSSSLKNLLVTEANLLLPMDWTSPCFEEKVWHMLINMAPWSIWLFTDYKSSDASWFTWCISALLTVSFWPVFVLAVSSVFLIVFIMTRHLCKPVKIFRASEFFLILEFNKSPTDYILMPILVLYVLFRVFSTFIIFIWEWFTKRWCKVGEFLLQNCG